MPSDGETKRPGEVVLCRCSPVEGDLVVACTFHPVLLVSVPLQVEV